MLKAYPSSGSNEHTVYWSRNPSTAKDKLAAIDAAPTVVLKKEVHREIVEDNYLLSVEFCHAGQ